MDSRILWLRTAYWAGAVADAVMVVAMLVPELNRVLVLNRAVGFDFSPEYMFAMTFGAALMAGWTVLLVWADRKPVARRGVLLITAITLVGLNAAKIMLYTSGIATTVSIAAVVAPLLLLVLMLFAYFNSLRGETADPAA